MELIDIIHLAEELNESMRTDARFIALTALERELARNSEVIALSETMKRCALQYEASLEEETSIIQHQQRLHQAKLELDQHPLVRKYYETYRPVRELYDLLQREIFTPFNLHVCGGGH